MLPTASLYVYDSDFLTEITDQEYAVLDIIPNMFSVAATDFALSDDHPLIVYLHLVLLRHQLKSLCHHEAVCSTHIAPQS